MTVVRTNHHARLQVRFDKDGPSPWKVYDYVSEIQLGSYATKGQALAAYRDAALPILRHIMQAAGS
ncbi:MAG: hypothetical protein ABIE42_09115 [Candidatus Eisenbacteria bacterium]